MKPPMKHAIAFILFIVTSFMVTAQKETNNWYFGKFAALNFNTGTPQVLFNSQMNATEGCSSISDKNGNLLFYSDGLYVWNRNHQRMIDPVTGTLSRIGDNSDGTQTGVIIPWPSRDSMYFVFSIGQTGGNLYYSVVNMNRNNGLGLVVITKVLLLESVCEKLTAVTHCNKQDFWAVTHKFNSVNTIPILLLRPVFQPHRLSVLQEILLLTLMGKNGPRRWVISKTRLMAVCLLQRIIFTITLNSQISIQSQE